MNEAADVLVPQVRGIKISGHSYFVRKLGLKQVIKLSHFMSTLHHGKLAAIREGIETGEQMLAILLALSDEQVPRLIGILLNAEEPDDIERFQNVGMEELSALVAALTEVNDFKKIAQNFRQTAANLKGVMDLIGTRSLLSSPK